MPERLRIGVVGAGSIGCYVGGKIVAGGAADVVFVGRGRVKEEIETNGMSVRDLGGVPEKLAKERVRFETEIAALRECDVILCCVKSAQTEGVGKEMAAVVRADATVVSLQNGMGNAAVLRAALPGRTVIAGIVSFNVVSRGEGLFHRTMDGPLMLEACPEPLAAVMKASRLAVEVPEELAPHQWTKLVVNLNNAISALSGAPTRTLLRSPAYRRIIAAVVDEALAVLKRAALRPARLRGVPLWLMPKVFRLPTALVKLVLAAQMRVDPEARSSMWEDLTRGRPTEVDYLNGEIVRLAGRVGATAPLNARIVELVHEAEAAGPGSPNLDADALWARLTSP